MNTAHANVPTAHADQYLLQLCKHWSHRLAVELTDRTARITMPSGAVIGLDARTEHLDVTIEAADADMLAETTQVLVDHLNRFAFREAPLSFDWQDARSALA